MLIMPLLQALSDILEFFLIKPMSLIGFPVAVQIFLASAFTATLSIFIRKAVRMEKEERDFHQKFSEKLSLQKDISKLGDWKMKKLMYDASDSELDEAFNTYIAGKYVRYAASYLIPLFAGEIWINNIFNPEKMHIINGMPHVLPIPSNSYGIEGISVSSFFLISYIIFLTVLFYIKGKIGRKISN